MNVLIGLLPFILMHALRAVVSARNALLISAGLAGLTVIRQLFASGAKTLSLVAFGLIGAVALASFVREGLAERGSGLVVNGGLTLFALGGLALGWPFTVEWASDTVSASYWNHPLFIHVNTTISLAWGLGFLALTLLAVPWPRPIPRRWRSVAAIVIMLAAAGVTSWYPSHAQQAAAAARPAR